MNSDLKTGRIKNTTRNIIYGFISVAVSAIASFILRNMMLNYLGVEFLGLNSFYQSLVETIGTAELGIGAAMVFFLYDPVAKNDYQRINAYTLYIKKAYYAVGSIILIGGLFVTPFLNILISTDIPENTNIYLLFIIYLLSVVLSYFLFPEEVFLAIAYQRDDYTQKIKILTDLFMWVTQFIGLIVFKSFVIYIFAQLIKSIEVGCFRYIYEKRKFSYVTPSGKLSIEEKKRIKTKIISMIGHQLDSRLLNGIDSIVISFFLGLTAVGVYGNYYLVLSTATWFVSSVFTAATSSIANAIIVDDVESNFVRYRSLHWFNAMISGWGMTCLLCIFQDFMSKWMGERYLYRFLSVIIFAIYFYITTIRKTTLVFKNAMGMWDRDRIKPYVSLLCDLFVDIVLIPIVGAIGAIVASIISEGVIELPWENRVLFSDYFEGKALVIVKKSVLYLITNIVSCCCVFVICSHINASGYYGVVIKSLVCSLLFAIINIFLYFKSDELKVWKDTLGILLRQ